MPETTAYKPEPKREIIDFTGARDLVRAKTWRKETGT